MLTIVDDWTSTFHRIPKLLDAEFNRCGATRVTDVGLGDVADGDIFNHFDKWQDEQLWSSIGGDVDPAEEGTVEVDIDTDARKSTLRQDVREATVISNKVLTAPGEPEKRHLVLTLPTGMSYKAGDYLAVLPINDQRNIRRALNRYNLPWDAMLTIKVGANTTLPTGHPVSAMDVLSAYVELGQPATRKVCFGSDLWFYYSWLTGFPSRTLLESLPVYQTRRSGRKSLLFQRKDLKMRF